jgi:hypothetical protein
MDCGSCKDLSGLISKLAAAKEAVMSARVSPKIYTKIFGGFKWQLNMDLIMESLRTSIIPGLQVQG